MDKAKLAALGERLKIGGERLKVGGAEIGRKVSGKMKEILQVQSQEAKMVDDATSDTLEEPNWGLNLRICNYLSSEEFNGSEVVRAIKKKLASKNTVCQRLSLDLLETCAMNCDKVFSEVASEKVLDEMVRMIDNPQTHYGNRQRALQLIEAWGTNDDLGYLPVFKQTYVSLKTREMPPSVNDDANSNSVYSSLEQALDEHAPAPVDRYPFPTMDDDNTAASPLAYHGGGLSEEERKEFLVITRNSIEILSSLLNTEAHQKPVKDDLMLSMVDKCKESQPFIQRIIESMGDDEPLLFEALNLNDELQQVLAKYEELELVDPPADLPATEEPRAENVPRDAHPDRVEAEEQKTLVVENPGVPSDDKNLENKS